MPHVLTLVEQFWHKVPGGTAKATERTLAALLDRPQFTATGLSAHRRSGSSDPDPAARVPARCRLVRHRLRRPVLYESWLRFDRPSVDSHMGANSVFWASSLIVAPCRGPVVSTVHDLDFLDHPEFLTKRGRDFFPRVWDRALQRSDHFVCPSEVVAQQCRRHGVADAPISVIPWGVDRPVVKSAEAAELVGSLSLSRGWDREGRRLLSLPRRFVLLVAPDQPRKNPEACAHALAETEVAAVIVGSVSEPENDRFAPLGDAVVRLGAVTDRQLSALYHQADALLFPSHEEGFGLPVLEAMAHGLPVVTSRGTATEEVAGGAAVLADPNDPGDVADALGRLLSDTELRRQMIGRGWERASVLSWDRTAGLYDDVFRSVL